MNFNELLGGVGKDLMNAAGEALAGAAKEYLGNAIQEIFVKKQADTKRQLTNIQHMKVVSSRYVLQALLMHRIMLSVWRLLGDVGKQRLEALRVSPHHTHTSANKGHSGHCAMRTSSRDLLVTFETENILRIRGNWSRLL